MSESPAFPPVDLPSFLALCAGEWMALRSSFELDQPADSGDTGDIAAEVAADDAERWHRSERGELRIEHQEGVAAGDAGSLLVTPPAEAGAGAGPRQLQFSSDGGFSSQPAGPDQAALQQSAGLQQGHWQLWPDGSLELVLQDGDREIRERIWFTKPNLRLRSCVARGPGEAPQQASFSSEIRRVRRPGT
ncbi:MAG: phycobiliprotein lyase [Cyanobium sp.]